MSFVRASQPAVPDGHPGLHGNPTRASPVPAGVTIFRDWTRYSSDAYGRCFGKGEQGLYAANTLFVSRLRYFLDGVNIERCLAYVVAPDTWFLSGTLAGSGQTGNLPEGAIPRGSLGITLRRQVKGGMTDLVRLTNYGAGARTVRLTLEVGCPILDHEWASEMKRLLRAPAGGAPRHVRRIRNGLELSYAKRFGKRAATPSRELDRAYRGHPPRAGEEVLRALSLRCASLRVPARFLFESGRPGRIHARIEIPPRSHADLRFCFDLQVGHRRLRAPRRVAPAVAKEPARAVPELHTSHAGLNLIVGQALSDLDALRLGPRGDHGGKVHAVAAGIPRYIGIFARDTLITGWQSVAFDRRLLRDAVETIGELQGTRFVPWREEEPGRLPHERRLNPLAETGATNRELYYGDVTSTPFYCSALATYYDWSADLAFVRRQEKVLRGCCDWLLRRLSEGAGFVYYAPAVSVRAGANRNQAWKDSGDAIVDDQGRIRVPPLALIEIQGYSYEALRAAAKLFGLLGDIPYARLLERRARLLKRDFNRKFWNPRQRRYALALREAGETRVMADASNVGHCLGTGIFPRQRVPRIVKNLMAPGMFSGWGIRTLGAGNPAYDPFSYHRGSVWPVENAEIAEELRKAGFRKEAERIIAAQLALALLFPAFRLPEVVTGHARTASEPLPGLYPKANLLQAWSSSAGLQNIQALLGLEADAGRNELRVAAHLPEWLEWAELRGLRVGKGSVSVRWERGRNGRTRVFVLERPRGLRIRRVRR